MKTSNFHVKILTLFPEMFPGLLGMSLSGKALEKKLWSLETVQLRDYATDNHKTVDDTPFGGGAGMVMKPDLLDRALTAQQPLGRFIYMTPRGKPLTQALVRDLVKEPQLTILCGRYEGVDERLLQAYNAEEICIGDYVLSGGELAAAILLDATVRLLPGVLGHADSSRYESFGEPDQPESLTAEPTSAQPPPRSTNAAAGLLDYPHYTRPAEFLGVAIPEPLGNGDHLAIRRWRRHAALAKTLANRPDLLPAADLSDDDREFLATLGYTPSPD